MASQLEHGLGGLCLDLLNSDVLVLDGTGAIVYANEHAQRSFDVVVPANVAPPSFSSLWTSQAGAKAGMGELLRRLAGASTWQPFTLERASGALAGLRFALQGRGFIQQDHPEGPTLFVVITDDPLRERSFGEHRRLVRELNGEVARHRRLTATLDRMLQEQKRLHQELVHRVKNNLSLLLSLLNINRNRSSSPEVRTILGELERRIHSVAAVHDILDRNHEVDFVRADQLIETICAALESSLAPEGVVIERDLAPLRLHVSDATPLALIINELATNALKHAFPTDQPGLIQIALKRNGVDKLEAVIGDNGVGSVARLDTGEGTGHIIIQSLADQLGAELSRGDGPGTQWQMIFAPPHTPETAMALEADGARTAA